MPMPGHDSHARERTNLMPMVPRTLLYLANRLLADPNRSSQNAAQASAILRERRHQREEVDAYLHAEQGGEP
jgi:hypothetical protein